MPRTVATFLMFDGSAEEAMNFYVSVFPGSAVTRLERYGAGEGGAEGAVKRSGLTIGGHQLMFFDSPIKHAFTFTPPYRSSWSSQDEAELDRAFARLSEGGQVLMPVGNYGFSSKFGWVSDRFGVSWQLNLD